MLAVHERNIALLAYNASILVVTGALAMSLLDAMESDCTAGRQSSDVVGILEFGARVGAVFDRACHVNEIGTRLGFVALLSAAYG